MYRLQSLQNLFAANNRFNDISDIEKIIELQNLRTL